MEVGITLFQGRLEKKKLAPEELQLSIHPNLQKVGIWVAIFPSTFRLK